MINTTLLEKWQGRCQLLLHRQPGPAFAGVTYTRTTFLGRTPTATADQLLLER